MMKKFFKLFSFWEMNKDRSINSLMSKVYEPLLNKPNIIRQSLKGKPIIQYLNNYKIIYFIKK
jgi:hypothetical protein